MKNKKILTRNIWIISLVSFFTDIASEMLYPVMPLYLKEIGFSIVMIGLLEGLAEATAGLSKGYFGKLSDIKGKRLPFIQAGYFLSAVSKPMMVILTYPLWIFFSRTLDRFGKGIRTGARDAMLSDETIPEHKGLVFGFHRSLDTFGACLGPIFALIFLYFYPGSYKVMFLLAFLPGIFSVLITFLIKEKKLTPKAFNQNTFFSFLKYWKESPTAYRKLVAGLLVITLFNSSDLFLLLMVKQSGASDSGVISVYIFYNLIYAIFSFQMGILGDKIGLKNTFTIGLFLYVIVYTMMAFNTDIITFYVIFLIYGVYMASTEGIAKAWISNITNKKDTATAIGFYTSFGSICSLLASTIAGLIWISFGAKATFLVTAAGVTLVLIYFIFTKFDKREICEV